MIIAYCQTKWNVVPTDLSSDISLIYKLYNLWLIFIVQQLLCSKKNTNDFVWKNVRIKCTN